MCWLGREGTLIVLLLNESSGFTAGLGETVVVAQGLYYNHFA